MSRIEQIIRRAFATPEAQDVNGFDALFADDAIIRNQSDGAEYRGKRLSDMTVVPRGLLCAR